MIITETSAMYNPSNPSGQTDYSIKMNWWQQVFNIQGDTDIVRHLPRYCQTKLRAADSLIAAVLGPLAREHLEV